MRSQANQLLWFAAEEAEGGEIEVENIMELVRGEDRGAPFFLQFYLSFERAIRKYINNPRTIMMEALVTGAIGLVVGASSSDAFRGTFREQYQYISLAGTPAALINGALMLVTGAGIASSPLGVACFGNELVIYWREASAGHSKLAYFLGKLASSILIMFMGILHYAGFFLIAYSGEALNTPYALLVQGSCYFTFFGLAMVCGTALESSQASLLSVMFAMMLPAFGGMLKEVPAGLQNLSFAKYGMELVFKRGTEIYEHVMYIQPYLDELNFEKERTEGENVAIILGVGVGLRIICYFLLTGMNKEKQR